MIKNEELEKNIASIFNDNNYIIPLYQRNYAWGEEEIFQLIQDIYENFTKNPDNNYFIGTLVVLRRQDGTLEVIDGQQRLTTTSLIIKFLDDTLTNTKLRYDSRPEAEAFLQSYYQHGNAIEVTNNHLVSHFVDAIEHIQNTIINPAEKQNITLSELKTKNDEGNFNAFREYFFNKVILIRVEIPQDTDVAHYFEVMNNRGEQLAPHEILKARLLENINLGEREILGRIWDVCSQMDNHIQSNFGKTERERFFGKNYDSFNFDISSYQKNEDENNTFLSINEILKSNTIQQENTDSNQKDDDDTIIKYQSIIDFPNFLMHIISLYLPNNNIPLNSDELLSTFEDFKSDIEAKKFIETLFFYRTVFDRFIVKTSEDDKAEDNYKWTLHKPELYVYEKQNQNRLVLKNAFDNQEKIIKCLSMLQVTFRTKKYKNWLQEVLSWFSSSEDLQINSQDYLKKLNKFVLTTFDDYGFSFEDHYSEGTQTPHFLFNVIDYLLWNENKYQFDFKYRNSIEHHLPQSFIELNTISTDILDSLGNLCLVSKGANSRMNNEEPTGKAKNGGKYYKDTLPPKQKMMYDFTNNQHNWSENQIIQHYREIIDLIKNRTNILK